MTYTAAAGAKPAIVVSDIDHERLSALASRALARDVEAAEELQAEMERAKVIAESSVPADVVRMGSTVVFRMDGSAPRRVTLVFPGDADIAQEKISVLTPIGAALIGLSVGQSITCATPDGRTRRLTVLRVEPPTASEENGAAEDERGAVVPLPRRPASTTTPDQPTDDDPGPYAA